MYFQQQLNEYVCKGDAAVQQWDLPLKIKRFRCGRQHVWQRVHLMVQTPMVGEGRMSKKMHDAVCHFKIFFS